MEQHKLMHLPPTAKVFWQIEEYICQNHQHHVGVSVNSPTFGHKYIAKMVSELYEITVDAYDVLATMRYMVEVGNLVSVGFFGSIETYSVSKDVARWETTHKGE